MESAIKETWPTDTIHLLCTYHLWKNFYKHIHPLFKGKADGWKAVAGKWWKIVKDSDEAGKLDFDARWRDLVDYIAQQTSLNDDQNVNRVKWLSNLAQKKEKWAACYTWSTCTFGIHSTQRAEAIHSAIAMFCKTTHSIMEFTNMLEKMSEEQQLKSEIDACKLVLQQQQHGGNAALMPAAMEIMEKVSPFAGEIVKGQALQAVAYSLADGVTQSADDADDKRYKVTRRQPNVVHPVSEDSTGNTVESDNDRRVDFGASSFSSRQREASLSSCSCQFHKVWGLPCRHMFLIHLLKQRRGSVMHLVVSFWQRQQDSSSGVSETVTPVVPARNSRRSRTSNGRKEVLKTTSVALCEIASARENRTLECQTLMSRLIDRYQEQDSSASVVRGSSTSATAAVSTAAASTTFESMSDMTAGGRYTPTTVANPVPVPRQKKRRRQPGNGGPTSSAYAKQARKRSATTRAQAPTMNLRPRSSPMQLRPSKNAKKEEGMSMKI